MLKDAQVRVLLLGILGGIIHDARCFVRTLNEWKQNPVGEKPVFNLLCFALNVAQGALVGAGFGQFLR